MPQVCLKQKGWFRSSVGSEQQPSKLWVPGSSPGGITGKPPYGGLFSSLSYGLYLQSYFQKCVYSVEYGNFLYRRRLSDQEVSWLDEDVVSDVSSL